MPVVGYTPFAKAAHIRSYIRDFYVGYAANQAITLTGNVIHIHYVSGAYFQDTYITLEPRWVPWSSNCYTLDFVVIDEYTDIMGAPTHSHSNYVMSQGIAGQTLLPYVAISYVGGTGYLSVPLPSAPPGYWLPLG